MTIPQLVSTPFDLGIGTARVGPRIDPRTKGARGDGTTDDTVALQAAITDAVTYGGHLTDWPGARFRVTDTITVQPTSGSGFINLGFTLGGKIRNIIWDGGSNKPVFRTRNYKYAVIQGIDVEIPGTVHDVVAWELATDATYQSNTQLVFRNCGVRIGTGAKGCGGWRAISNGGAGDYASLGWDSCGVFGDETTYQTDGNFGWRVLAANALIWNWWNCIAAGLAVGWNNQLFLTQLNGAITDTATTLTVDAAGYYPYAGTVTIDSERISYTSRSSTQLLGCTRGVGGTTAAAHSDNAVVSEYTTFSGVAGAAWTVTGPNVDTVGTVFHMNRGPLAVYGGRCETIDRLLLGGYGGSGVRNGYLFSGHRIASATPPSNVLIALGNAAQLRLESCDFSDLTSDYTAAMITATGTDNFGPGGAMGSVTIEDSSFRGSVASYWTVPATWIVKVRNSTRMNSSAVHQARIDTRTKGTATIASGATSVTVTHGLPSTPTLAGITVTLGENPTNDIGAVWVDGITATQFVVNVEADPGASNLDLGWIASVE